MKNEGAKMPELDPKSHDQRNYKPCSASPFCRYPGLIRAGTGFICVEHYSRDPIRFEKSPE